jgi:neurotransmitter:Na+ symporter, NSS family
VAIKQIEQFSSRWALLLAMIGIAVGTGNIWRFPRIAAKYDGGAFLIAWLVFLFLWSIPIILIEYGIGKHIRMGTVGAFGKILGPGFSWMGAFVGFVSTAIMFYYSVVAGWCLYYFLQAASGGLSGLDAAGALQHWNQFIGSAEPALYHLVAMAIGGLVLWSGVTRGIEKTNKVLVPSLLILLLALLVRSVTLPGAVTGIESFFTVRWESLLDHRLWLDALTQNAWSTGAGWGLILTYAVYMRPKEDTNLNAAITAFADHSVSLVVGITIFATVYALLPGQAASVISEPGPLNTGLAFIWIPRLFSELPGGSLFTTLFFLALSFAAVSSLIAMIELAVRILNDAGLARKPATIIVTFCGFLLGLPSALSPTVFLNQDWVWGVGLIVSGGFFAFAVLRFGVARFRRLYLNTEESDLTIGRWYDIVVKYVIPLEAFSLLGWWFWVAVQADLKGWWNPLRAESVGTCLAQWGIAILTLILLNRRIASRTLRPS